MTRNNENEIVFNYEFNDKEKEICNSSIAEIVLHYLVNPLYIFK